MTQAWLACHSLLPTPVMAAPPAFPQQGEAQLFEHADFKGKVFTVRGQEADFKKAAVGNDKVSSVRTGPNTLVTLYEHINFGGEARVISGQASGLGADFNDKASSALVELRTLPPGPPPGTVWLFTLQGFQGKEVQTSGNVNNFKTLGVNDQVSSLRVAEGFEAEVFTDADFKGKAHKVSGNVSVLPANFNKQISSIRINAQHKH